MEHRNEPFRPTPEQVCNWWRGAAETVNNLIEQMSQYLPDEDTPGFEGFMDQASLQEVAGSVYAARANADAVAGAADRVVRNQGKRDMRQRETPRETPRDPQPRRTPGRFTSVG